MKKTLITAALALTLFSCSKKEEEAPKTANKSAASNFPGQMISSSQANEEIGSYLESINYPDNDSTIRGFLMNADTLRLLLSNPEVKGVMTILCHDKSYAEDSYGIPTQTHLSMVVVGLNSDKEIITTHVMNFLQPCPPYCTLDGGLIP